MRDSDDIPKGHVCPPSKATHPRDRWETVFAYSFILKFTDLKKKVEDFGNVMECACLAYGVSGTGRSDT